MMCALPANNAKIFAKAVNTIAKFGDIYFEPETDGLSLKSINSSRSAYITFKFFDCFFSDYEYENSNQDNFDGKCKVSIKTFLSIFKNMKQVDQCKISVDSDAEKLIVELNCKLDTRKKYAVSILDIEALQPGNIGNFDNRNKICGSTKIFSDISNNFQMAEEEITIVAEPSRVIVKNYIDGQIVDQKFMRSQLKLKGEEFDIYSIKSESNITFCLREFRALLNFAESVNIDFSMFFEDAGMPVVFKIANMSVFEVTLFMSTLSPDDISMLENNANKSNTIDLSVDNNKNDTAKKNKENDNAISEKLPDIISLDDDEADITDAELMKLDLEDKTKNSPNKIEQTSNISISKHGEARHRVSNRSSYFPPPVHLNMSDEDSVTFVDTEAQNDYIPKSPQPPPNKKARRLFKRCFEPTFISSDSDTVLALDSDIEYS